MVYVVFSFLVSLQLIASITLVLLVWNYARLVEDNHRLYQIKRGMRSGRGVHASAIHDEKVKRRRALIESKLGGA